MTNNALLAFADGTIYYGKSIGWHGQTCGECVFNTSMTGYQEILTDPSYAEQIVLLTTPHIGNTGINIQDYESSKIFAQGLIIRDYPQRLSNWRSQMSLSEFLQAQRLIGISDIDTRHVTKQLVAHGAQNVCLQAGQLNPEAAVQAARAYVGLNNRDLASNVSCHRSTPWAQASIDLQLAVSANKRSPAKAAAAATSHIVAVDYGVKHMMLRLLVDRGCKVTVVPAQTSAEDILALRPDGVLLSNGPGDPAACHAAIAAVKTLIETDVPVLGICLGFQILALAAGAKTFKMTFGHHGANHPVQDCASKKVFITSQNHGFAVDEKTLPESFEITHRSLFDNTIQGLRHRHKAILAFQGHPEASPGPHDMLGIFDQFIHHVATYMTKTEQLLHA